MPKGFEWLLDKILKPEILEKKGQNKVNEFILEFLPFLKPQLVTITRKCESGKGIPQGGIISPLLMN